MAFTTAAKLTQANVPGGVQFVPTITFGGSSTDVTYTSQVGYLFRPFPGVIQFHGRCLLSAKGDFADEAAMAFRMPFSDIDLNPIQEPVLTTIHNVRVAKASITPCDEFTGIQSNLNRDIRLLKRVGAAESELTFADVPFNVQVFVQGFYFYTP